MAQENDFTEILDDIRGSGINRSNDDASPFLPMGYSENSLKPVESEMKDLYNRLSAGKLGLPGTAEELLGVVVYVDATGPSDIRTNTSRAIIEQRDRRQVRYLVYCAVPPYTDGLGTDYPDEENLLSGPIKDQMPYFEYNGPKPAIKSRVWIKYNPLALKKEARFVKFYDDDQSVKFISTSESTDPEKTSRDSTDIGGMPAEQDTSFGEMISIDSQQTIAGQVFSERSADSWLQACANQNGWGASLTKTKFSPPPNSGYFSDRDFQDLDRLNPSPSAENLFAVVYHNGSPSIGHYWKACAKQAPKASTHYYVDNKNMVHEFISSKMKAQHAASPSCPYNNDLSVGINFSSFSKRYTDMYQDYTASSKLKTPYRDLLRSGCLPLGAPRNLGMPTPTGKIFNDPFCDLEIFPSAPALETGYKLTNCIANKYNIEISKDIPLISFIKSEKKLGKIPDSVFTENNVPYFYNPDDLKTVVTSWRRNTLCGFSGLNKYKGVIAETWFSAGKRWGGTIQEFYFWLRTNNINQEDAFYIVLGSLATPGVARGKDVLGDILVDSSAYSSKFGQMYSNIAAIPNPLSTTGAYDFLKELGKRYYDISNFYRELILHRDEHVRDPANANLTSFVLAAPIGTVDGIKTPWDQLGMDMQEELFSQVDCMEIYETLRKKMFETHMKLNSDIKESNFTDYQSDFGIFLTKTSLQLMHYLSLKPEALNLKQCFVDNESFNNSFVAKYKLSVNSVIKT